MQVLREPKVTAELLGSLEPKVTKERGVLEDLQGKLGSLGAPAQLDQRGQKESEVNKGPWDFLVPEDHPDFPETSDFQVFLGFKVHQALLDSLVNLELQENQEVLVKLLLQAALKPWPSQDPQGQLGLQVLLELQVCLVPLVQRESLELQAPKENQEPTASLERMEKKEKREKRETREIKVEKETKERAESQVSAPALNLSAPQRPANWALLRDLQDLLDPRDLLDPQEWPDLRALQVKVWLVLQEVKDLQDLQDLQGSVSLDLKESLEKKESLETKESLAALFLHQTPSLRDLQDLPGLKVQRVQQVNLDHQDSKVNQDNQDFLAVRENQATVSLGRQDQWGPLDHQVHPPHPARLDLPDLLVRAVTLLM